MVVIAPPPSLSPPSEQAMTESSRGAPLHIPTSLQNAISESTSLASTSTNNNNITGNGASVPHYNNHYPAAQTQYAGRHTQAPYINNRKGRPYSQYTNGIPAHRNNPQIYSGLTHQTNGNTGLLTTVTPRHHNRNNGHLYHHCTFPCSASSVLTGGDAALPTRFSFGPGFEPQQLFGVGRYGGRTRAVAAGATGTPRVSQQHPPGATIANNHQEHIVLFHVNPGVTIRFQIGDNLEVLRGGWGAMVASQTADNDMYGNHVMPGTNGSGTSGRHHHHLQQQQQQHHQQQQQFSPVNQQHHHHHGHYGAASSSAASTDGYCPELNGNGGSGMSYYHLQPTDHLCPTHMCSVHDYGPVTVPMVSTNSTPPIAMPIQVPVGHMVQQIVDERGTLRHVILSTTHPANIVPMPHQHYSDGTTGTNGLTTSTSTTTSSGGPAHHPVAASAAAGAGQQPPPPPPGSVGGYHHYGHTPPPNQQPNSGGGANNSLGGGPSLSAGYGPPHHHHPSPHYHTNMPPPPGGGGGGGGMQGEVPGQFYNKDERTQRQYNKLRKKLIDKRKEQEEAVPGGSVAGGGRGTNSSSSSTSSSSGVGGVCSQSSQQASLNQRLRQAGGMVMLVKEKVGGMNSVGTSEDGEESSSVQEDDDTILADMLSSVQAPTVSELSSRCALLQWAVPLAIVDHNSTLASIASSTSTSSGLSTAGSSTASSLSPASSVVTSTAAASPVTTVGSSAGSTVDLPEINESRLRYEVLLSDGDKGRRFKSIYSGRSLSCRIQDLRPGQEYTVCLQVHLEELRGTATDPIRFTTPACEPDQPLPPQLNARKKNSLQLKWNAPDNDNGSHIIHYILEVVPSSSPTTSPSSLPSTTSSDYTEAYRGKSRTYILQKLIPSTSYRFRVCAVNGVGPSLCSDIVCFRTLEPAPPAPESPKLLEANIHDLRVRWEKRDGVDGVFNLEMESDSMRYMPVFNGEGTEFHIRDLSACTEYKFRLTASNEGGCSPWSEEARYSTRPAAPHAPAKPTVRGRIGAHSFRLGWEPPHKTGGAPVTEYTVELNSGAGFETIYTGSGTDTACTSLSPGTTYQARVSCLSQGGLSPFSDSCTVTTDAVVPNQCPAPSLKGGQPNASIAKPPADRYVIITLQAPDYQGGAPVLEYEVEMGGCSAGGVDEIDSVTFMAEKRNVYKGRDLECLVANLLPGTTYSFTSRAINRIGGGTWSVPLIVTTAAAVPDAPAHLTGLCRTAHCAQLEWCIPEANGAPVIEYRLETSLQADFTLPDPTTITTVSVVTGSHSTGSYSAHEIRGLTPFTIYYFRLFAVNSTGTSPSSATLTLVTPASTPAIPNHMRCEPSPTALLITWSPPACHGSPVTHYNVDVADVTYSTATAEPELLVEELVPETVYKVRVQACNSVGCGGYSGVLKTATLKMPPEAPRVECVATAWNSLKLKWGEGKNQDYTTYHLELLNPFTHDYYCVYRGSAYTFKVNKLHEQTRYQFRICAENDAGRGRWSDVDWEFETAVAPPAAVRMPRVVEMDGEQRLCTLEWTTVSKGQTADDTVVYVLQLAVVSVAGSVSGVKRKGGADKELRGDQLEFREVYRGPETRYSIAHFDVHSEYHARVCPVRLCASGESLIGTQSPVLMFPVPTVTPSGGNADPSMTTYAMGSAISSVTALTSRSGVNCGSGVNNRSGGGKTGSAGMQKVPVMKRVREMAKSFAEAYKVSLLSFLVVFISVLLTTIIYILVN